MSRRNKNYGREPTGKYAQMLLAVMDTPAWRALSSAAQALYPWLVMEFKGKQFNNNGQIRLSVRQAALKMGKSKDTAARAFRDLQAKGFLRVVTGACLGVSGMGKTNEYEITTITTSSKPLEASDDFNNGSKGNDFDVFEHPPKNPEGKNKPCHNYKAFTY